MQEVGTTKVQAVVPDNVADALVADSRLESRSLSNYIATILQDWFKRREDGGE